MLRRRNFICSCHSVEAAVQTEAWTAADRVDRAESGSAHNRVANAHTLAIGPSSSPQVLGTASAKLTQITHEQSLSFFAFDRKQKLLRKGREKERTTACNSCSFHVGFASVRHSRVPGWRAFAYRGAGKQGRQRLRERRRSLRFVNWCNDGC